MCENKFSPTEYLLYLSPYLIPIYLEPFQFSIERRSAISIWRPVGNAGCPSANNRQIKIRNLFAAPILCPVPSNNPNFRCSFAARVVHTCRCGIVHVAGVIEGRARNRKHTDAPKRETTLDKRRYGAYVERPHSTVQPRSIVSTRLERLNRSAAFPCTLSLRP